MSELIKTKLFMLIPGILTIIILSDYFFAGTLLTSVTSMLRNFAVVISAIALGLGVINLFLHHGRNIQKKRKGIWPFSAAAIISFIITFALGAINLQDSTYQWILNYVYNNLISSLYATTGFYIVSSAYRSFRARNTDAALLLISGVILMLTNAPIGGVILPPIPILGNWLLAYGQLPAMRVFMMIAAFGILAYSFRFLLGKERGFYGMGGSKE